MGITKWDLFKQIDKMPVEKYNKIKEYLDELNKKSGGRGCFRQRNKKELRKII